MRTHSSTALSVVAAAIVAASSVAAAPYDAELKQRYEAAKAEGKVVMYSVESIELIQELADAFKARFPGIDFDFFRGDSTQIAQRFEAEAAAGRHLSDVLMLTATDSENMTRDGLLLDTNSPVAKSYPAGTQPTNGYWYNYGLNTVGFAYNTDLVKPNEAPKTWEDLLDPKWKGKIGMQDPKSGGGGAHAWVARMYQVYGEERWFEFMDKNGRPDRQVRPLFPDPRIARLG